MPSPTKLHATYLTIQHLHLKGCRVADAHVSVKQAQQFCDLDDGRWCDTILERPAYLTTRHLDFEASVGVK